jgi:MFS family permease
MVASLFVWIADWRGRKLLIFIGAVGVCIATVVIATAKTLPVFIGGRFLLAYTGTLAHTGAIIYLTEMAPTRYRGTLAGLYNTNYYFVSGTIFFVGCLTTVRGQSWRRQPCTGATYI